LKSVSRFNEESVDAAKASWSRADRTLVTKMGDTRAGYTGSYW
jgi:hypothetical protein